MKALLSTFSRSAVMIICLSYSACIKDPHHPAAIPECRVYQLSGDINYPGDTITIRYNSKGNPIAMDKNHVTTGSPRYVFKYDKNDRLTELIGMYNHPTNYETLYRFSYDYKNRIKADTQYTFGFIGQPAMPEYIHEYEYDSKGRMTRYRHISLYSSYRWEHNFQYNAQGNLSKVINEYGNETSAFPYDYDDKVNVNSLHPIWQFLSHDYSRNNHSPAVSYNNKGLPTEIDLRTKYQGSFANLPINHVQISYQCR
ncbi:hypothetical protein [Chitinophaga pinensis]|uniref:YD repeat-containing protein n=1 Tax=Chitinophaga pinensis (strain ATCC 43595 / DSM 2588 / LMG 13176 / NBRC 15968 / NCIMB 11800 / UQM 2034) TaxID=485918 RepID=A0A979G6W9_CHIPD|nr:hypothetical protein [Chitinophaga pinensis]ACU61871.1 hypothetical protein Cpin_4427 [Chitinophaga pinensis DSM 2588]